MALLYADGFDAGDTSLRWFTWSGSRSTDTRFNQGSSWHVTPRGAYFYKSFAPIGKIIVGFAVKFATSNSVPVDWFSIQADNGVTTHLVLRISSSNILQLVRGDGTVLASAPSVPFTFEWGLYYEVSATIADAGGTCEVRVNGQTVINFTGDTKNGGTSTAIDRVRFANDWVTVMVDDLYICDNTGSAPNNNFLGDIRVHTLTPDAAGSLTQMTPSSGANYTTVDELPYNAADYVRGGLGQTDLYSTSNLPAGVNTIFGVQANAIVKKTDAGGLSGRTVIKSGATTTNGTSVALGTSDATISTLHQQNPDTSTSWTPGDVNTIEIGVGAV